ncbi:MAG: lysophospholipase [Coxiellaceae bacterium]|jgi:alpha-beta hydrolase superfamily lysophospholipase|nr:lysophospholipase [Coxiellaceae bacterium]
MELLFIHIIIAYSIIVYFFSDSMIFFPPPVGYHQNLGGRGRVIQLRTRDGAKIFAYYLPNKDAKYTLLVSHGNAEDIGYMVPFFQEMYKRGFSVLGYDYRGYGLSEGKPSEVNTYLDIDVAYDYLVKDLHVAPENIISFGHSVGAAVALDLAVRKPVGAVILQGAFVTASRVMTRIPILPFDKFNNLRER